METVGGWALAVFFVFLPLYKAGIYTNAEYLEAHYGPLARVHCAFVQVQYRTLVLAIMGGSLYWTVQRGCDARSCPGDSPWLPRPICT